MHLLSIAGGVASFGSPFIDLDWTVGGERGLALAAGLSLYPDENEKHGGDGRYYVWFLSPSWVADVGAARDRVRKRGPLRGLREPARLLHGRPVAAAARQSADRTWVRLWAGDTGEDRNYGLIVDRASLGAWSFKLGAFRSEWVSEREVFQYLDAVTEAGDGVFGAILYPGRDYGSWSGELQAARDFEVAADWRANLLLSLRGRDVRRPLAARGRSRGSALLGGRTGPAAGRARSRRRSGRSRVGPPADSRRDDAARLAGPA